MLYGAEKRPKAPSRPNYGKGEVLLACAWCAPLCKCDRALWWAKHTGYDVDTGYPHHTSKATEGWLPVHTIHPVPPETVNEPWYGFWDRGRQCKTWIGVEALVSMLTTLTCSWACFQAWGALDGQSSSASLMCEMNMQTNVLGTQAAIDRALKGLDQAMHVTLSAKIEVGAVWGKSSASSLPEIMFLTHGHWFIGMIMGDPVAKVKIKFLSNLRSNFSKFSANKILKPKDRWQDCLFSAEPHQQKCHWSRQIHFALDPPRLGIIDRYETFTKYKLCQYTLKWLISPPPTLEHFSPL